MNEVLAFDNATVVDELGLNHQLLVEPLKAARNAALASTRVVGLTKFTFGGTDYNVDAEFSSFELSPFAEGTQTNLILR